ncbi:MAG TPA: MFS transporter, partial [Gammaproteobacteria bacterium]|nr:MFS transporter [Gammaproteobacteria bacterium]
MNRKTDDMTFPWWLVVYEIAVYLSMDAYMPALPKIAYAFGVDSHTAQLTAIVWMLGGLLVQLVFGPLSDRYGRRPILLFGGGLYVVSTIVCAFSSDIHTMLIARFFQGMAMPSMFIAGYAAINELFESEKAVKILARMN